MKKIPLEPKDIPPGSCIRRIGVNEWCSITRCTNEFIVSDFGMMLFTSIYGFEIYHPIIYPNWSLCYKEVEQ